MVGDMKKRMKAEFVQNLQFEMLTSNGVPKEKAGVPSKTLRHLQQINTYRLIMLHMENDF